MDDSKPFISTLDQVRALVDPIRVRMMEVLLRESRPMTVKQVADALEEKPHRLYHHMAVLEQAGLVKLVDVVIKSGIAEKYYQPTVESLRIDAGLFHKQMIPDVEFYQLMVANLDALLARIRRSIEQGLLNTRTSPPAIFRFSKPIRLSREQAEMLHQKIGEFYEQLREQGSEAGEFEYQLGVIFYPTGKTESYGGE